MGDIVRIQLQRVEKLLADRRMTLALDAEALHWLADKGYDPVYGARPLKRVIQKELVDPIAKQAAGRRVGGRRGDRLGVD
jgi:ATP-dependent Clp protease ATP-binding subunit ClpB